MNIKIDKDSLAIFSVVSIFLSVVVYSWVTNNFLAKTFVLGLEGCAMFTTFVFQKLLG